MSLSQLITEEKETIFPPPTIHGDAAQGRSMQSSGPLQRSHAAASPQLPHRKPSDRTLEHAMQDYLEDQKRHHRRPKTLEWHEQALGLFQSYLLTEHQCILPNQITEAQVRGWFAALPLMPTAIGTHRSPNTVESYARSARAFCQWLVRHRYLQTTPFAHLDLPRMENHVPRLLEPEEWEQLLFACHSPKEIGTLADQAAARNRAILWVLFDTGMRISEVCGLHLGDVDREQRTLRVREKGSEARRLTLGHEGLHHLLAYLDTYRLRGITHFERGGENSEPLFLSEAGRPLTKGAVALLFGRLRKRAGMGRKDIRASLLREGFALRYLRAGGDHYALWELLGQKESASFQHYLQMSDEGMTNEKRKRS
jgi:site-specific recombinase XerD